LSKKLEPIFFFQKLYKIVDRNVH